jgi:Conserved nitrate reductase-associated protein (Nitr_red_assoc)
MMICHAPAALSEECEALGLFINEAVLSRSGSPPRVLATDVPQSADPPSEPPIRLMANASASSLPLGKREWERLDDDQRYALVKLGDTDKPSHNLKAALLEFLGGLDSVVASDV